ncbi:MerR family transcriptional regulator [Saccharibacillus sacchari]|uniref:MerR family transcriptional regulator n=1 Tax=Saccharibacillus sacchari TaxID=456493 RepID=A0ACC6P8M4_9BACL
MPENQTYTVGAFAKLTGVTERTLRFYHKKGLLEPSAYTERGHRLYTDRDLIRLQQILTLKFLDYPLERIAEELEAEGSALRSSLEHQEQLLRQKRDQLDRMLHTLEHTLNLSEGVDEAEWEPDVLLLMIHSVSTEEQQRRWMAERIPDSLMQRFWPEGKASEKWRAIERETMQWISRLKRLMRAGLPPEDPAVQQFATELSGRIGGMLSRLEEPLTEKEMKALESFAKIDLSQTFQLPVTFTTEEERYVERMWDALVEDCVEHEDGETPDEGGNNGR